MEPIAHEVSAFLLIPFVLMLLSIAIGPVVAGHWWEKNINKLVVALVLGIPTAIILIAQGFGHELQHQIVFDYIPFVLLLGGLFTVTGGIRLSGDIRATPGVNTLFLGIGAILASLMGTTGAAMLLIRPVLETNKQRKHTVHTVLFFIAIVANAGGLLTPLGDPPLFLLYLRGAPFTWFLKLAPEAFIIDIVLLATYYIMDRINYAKESVKDIARDVTEVKPLRLEGAVNFIWLLGIVASVAFINEQYIEVIKTGSSYWKFLREGAIILMMVLSLITTKRKVREANRFTWDPILEVAFLFIGIFITMTPALIFLQEHASNMGLHSPLHFFFATGALSGFLDNAPTALAFHSVASGLPQIADAPYVAGIPEILLKAISMGAVLFGSMTYIGNGPNFMVKAIAEAEGIKMPSFFAYMYKFSLIILLPLFAIIGILFLWS
ncbi:MAG: sodium:proton antiporter [Bacteroides sp.]